MEETVSQEYLNETTRKLYQDPKDKKWKVWIGRVGKFPLGCHVGAFNTEEEAKQAVKENPEAFDGGIPLCNALKQWRKEHGLE